MSTVLFLESVAGVAGDMFAAAFVDAGLVEPAELTALAAHLGLNGVRVEADIVVKAMMRATHLRVVVPENEGHAQAGPGEDSSESHLIVDAPATHRHTRFVDIDRLIERSRLTPGLRDFARRVFRLLAEAEAEAHGRPVDEVAFHELGATDSIMDVVMAAYCLEKVGATRCYATPIRPGRGLVKIAHGVHPVPPPASARLLAGLPVAKTPAAVTRENVELSTPTGIAILKAIAPEFVAELPAGTVRQQGMGAGTMDLGVFPNVFRVIVLDASVPAPLAAFEADRAVEITCNIDDDTSEHMAWVAERLLAQGALDVWMAPATGKKGRPIVCLSLLADEANWQRLADWMLRNSTTFGLRHHVCDRVKLARRFETRSTPKGKVTYKIGLTKTGEVLKEKPEFDEQRRIWEADETGRTF